MGKVNLLVKYCLRNEKVEYNIKGILIDNKIKFKDSSYTMILDFNHNTLERSNKDSKIIFDFKKEMCFIVEETYNVEFKILVIDLIINKNYFYVKYQIEKDLFEIEIKLI